MANLRSKECSDRKLYKIENFGHLQIMLGRSGQIWVLMSFRGQKVSKTQKLFKMPKFWGFYWELMKTLWKSFKSQSALWKSSPQVVELSLFLFSVSSPDSSISSCSVSLPASSSSSFCSVLSLASSSSFAVLLVSSFYSLSLASSSSFCSVL